jgi:hypothetical protein
MFRSRTPGWSVGLTLLLLLLGLLAYSGAAQATQRTVLAELFSSTT